MRRPARFKLLPLMDFYDPYPQPVYRVLSQWLQDVYAQREPPLPYRIGVGKVDGFCLPVYVPLSAARSQSAAWLLAENRSPV